MSTCVTLSFLFLFVFACVLGLFVQISMCLPCILRSHTCTYRDRDRDRDSFQSLCVCVHRFFSYSLFTGHLLAVMYLQRGPPIAENETTTHRTHRTHRLGFFDKLLHQCPLESPCRGTGRKRDGICCSYSFITFCQNKYRRLLFFTVTVAQRRAFKDYLTDVCFCSKDKKIRNKY